MVAAVAGDAALARAAGAHTMIRAGAGRAAIATGRGAVVGYTQILAIVMRRQADAGVAVEVTAPGRVAVAATGAASLGQALAGQPAFAIVAAALGTDETSRTVTALRGTGVAEGLVAGRGRAKRQVSHSKTDNGVTGRLDVHGVSRAPDNKVRDARTRV